MHFPDFISQLTEQKLENVSLEDMLLATQHKNVTTSPEMHQDELL